jgi:hypothetical protein
MQQLALRVDGIAPPDGHDKWRADEGRRALSHTVQDMHPAIFNHSASGGNINSVPKIRFRGGCNGFGAVVSGSIPDDVRVSLLDAFMTFALESGGRLSPSSIDVGIDAADRNINYGAVIVLGSSGRYVNVKGGKRVFEDRREKRQALIDDKNYQMKQVKRAIAAGIARQYYSLDIPSQATRLATLDLGSRPVNGEVDYDELSDFIDSITITKIEAMSMIGYRMRFYVKFQMPVNLKGDWVAGRLTSRGFGQLICKDKKGV